MFHWIFLKRCELVTQLVLVYVGQAASIEGLCVTPANFKSNLGEFCEYCPVNLALHEEFIDCSSVNSLTYAASYRQEGSCCQLYH